MSPPCSDAVHVKCLVKETLQKEIKEQSMIRYDYEEFITCYEKSLSLVITTWAILSKCRCVCLHDPPRPTQLASALSKNGMKQ